jgi:hypothetical protein
VNAEGSVKQAGFGTQTGTCVINAILHVLNVKVLLRICVLVVLANCYCR